MCVCAWKRPEERRGGEPSSQTPNPSNWGMNPSDFPCMMVDLDPLASSTSKVWDKFHKIGFDEKGGFDRKMKLIINWC